MMLWNEEPSTFSNLRRPQNYVLMNNRRQWYDIPISASLPSAGTITIPPRVFHSKGLDSAGPSNGDLPFGHKSVIESYLCDKTTPPMSPPLDELPSETPQSGTVMAPTSQMWAQICYGVDLEAPVR
jgi:hypothetical protein